MTSVERTSAPPHTISSKSLWESGVDSEQEEATTTVANRVDAGIASSRYSSALSSQSLAEGLGNETKSGF